MAHFNQVNGGSGIYMATAAYNADALAVTGSYYYAADYLNNIVDQATGGMYASALTNDAHILWGDVAYGGFEGFKLAGQVGTVMDDDFAVASTVFGNVGADDTVAWGLKAGGNWDNISATLAYSDVNDGGVGVFNVGGVKTPLYTQLILNQDAIRKDASTIVAKAGLKTGFGKFGIAYNYSDLGANAYTATAFAPRRANNAVDTTPGTVIHGGAGTYSELDLTYKVKVFNDSTTLFAGYIYQADERDAFSYKDATNTLVTVDASDRTQNTLRFWGRYNF